MHKISNTEFLTILGTPILIIHINSYLAPRVWRFPVVIRTKCMNYILNYLVKLSTFNIFLNRSIIGTNSKIV